VQALRVSRLQAVLSAKQDWAEAKRMLALTMKQKAEVAEVGTGVVASVERELVGAMMSEIESMASEALAAAALAEKKVVLALVFAEGMAMEQLASVSEGRCVQCSFPGPRRGPCP
jgi:hypothetical protein